MAKAEAGSEAEQGLEPRLPEPAFLTHSCRPPNRDHHFTRCVGICAFI